MTPARERPGRPLVLVVDDDPDILEAICDVLEVEGYRVARARQGQEALERVGEERPRAILLDLMMPVMSGWEFLEHLEREGKLDDGIRVVVVSAALADVPKGPVQCMRKPVRAEQLIATVRRYC